MPERLRVPPIPHAFERAFRIWRDMHAWRQTGLGLSRLTMGDLRHYMDVYRDPLSRGDIAALAIIEDEFHASRAAAEERRQKVAEKKPKR